MEELKLLRHLMVIVKKDIDSRLNKMVCNVSDIINPPHPVAPCPPPVTSKRVVDSLHYEHQQISESLRNCKTSLCVEAFEQLAKASKDSHNVIKSIVEICGYYPYLKFLIKWECVISEDKDITPMSVLNMFLEKGEK